MRPGKIGASVNKLQYLEKREKAVAIASLGIGLGVAALVVGAAGAAIELQYRRRPGNKLELDAGTWQMSKVSPNHISVEGEMEFKNKTQTLEIMVPDVSAKAKLLSKGSLEGITTKTQITPLHKDATARNDGYWFGYIVKIGKTTRMKVAIDIEGQDLSQLQTAWVKVNYLTYGPEGRIPKTKHIIFPLQYPEVGTGKWRNTPVADVMAIKTHLLTHLDTPVEIVKKYVSPQAQPGDIVTIAESPIAIMQGRFIDPATIKPGFVAKRMCYYFMPTSSLATACGMQTLVNIVGPLRVVFAFVVGALAKAILRKPGVFYQLAGEQARLIDDVTGTLPPYDQFIVLGPANPQQVVDEIKKETGLGAAIVDVNDLKAVKILAATPDVSQALLEQALLNNPAGNADEQTPVVLIRPTTGS